MKSLDTNILLYAADEDCHELRSWPLIHAAFSSPAFPRRRTYDQVLAVTLRSNGVSEFYTRNVLDFRDAGFTRVINPID
jgi:predicted nucleic acid-binding protein